jgi:hypothetical protein
MQSVSAVQPPSTPIPFGAHQQQYQHLPASMSQITHSASGPERENRPPNSIMAIPTCMPILPCFARMEKVAKLHCVFCISTHAMPSSFAKSLPVKFAIPYLRISSCMKRNETKRNETKCCASLQAAKTHLGNPASRISHRASPHGSSSRATLNQTWRPACTARNWRRRFGLRQYRAGLVGIACSRCLRGHRNRRRLRGLCSRPCPLNPYLRHH